MKKTFFLIMLAMLMVAGLQTALAQKMIVTLDDGSKVEYDITKVKDVTFVESEEHEWVDLGLPSGTKWATCNVGASSPEEYGNYFAWGETEPKDKYNWSTYFDKEDGGDTFKKYINNGGLTELLPEDDAAAVNWGDSWRMPTLTQMRELVNNCSREWTQQNGVNGILLTGPSGGQIFLPAAGYRWVGNLYRAGSNGYYWSSSLYPYEDIGAYNVSFDSDYWNWGNYDRDGGLSIRPVRKQ